MRTLLLLALFFTTLPGPAAADDPPVFLRAWGSVGSAPGQFRSPGGIAADSQGNIFVADIDNNRVQEFSAQGSFVRVIGTPGHGDGQLSQPYDVAVSPSGLLYVADTGNLRIEVFDLTGAFVTTIVDTVAYSPHNIAIDPNGRFMCTIDSHGMLSKLTLAGVHLADWYVRGFRGEAGFAITSSGTIFVGAYSENTVREYTSTGVLLHEFGGIGATPGRFANVLGVAVDDSGNIYVADDSGRIQKIRSDLTFATQWGSSGAGSGQFAPGASALLVRDTSYIYTSDTGNNRVQEYADTTTPTLRSTWGLLKQRYR